MASTIHSKLSQDYRFLPELLMPIVTISEDQINNDSNERIDRDDVINLKIKEESKDRCKVGNNGVISSNTAQNLQQEKLKNHALNTKETLLVPKVEKDAESVEAAASDVTVKIKEEVTDHEAPIDCVVSSDLLASVAKVIELANQKQNENNNSDPSESTEEQPSEVKTEVVKRKRGRPRKYPLEESNTKKATQKKGRKQSKSKKSKGKNKSEKTHKKSRKGKKSESETLRFTCPICKDEVKRTEKELRLHYKNDHEGRRLRTSMLSNETIPCDICGKEFRSAYHLKEHMETHNNYYNCEMCDSSHKKILDFVIHTRMHSEKGFFKCVFCEYITEDIVQITDHLNAGHEQSFKYLCGLCKKGFHIFSWFEEHKNFHQNLKPFACELCGKSFMYSRYLSAHKHYMHKDFTNQNIHECVICHKQYQHRNSLKLHMNSHTGNFAICDVCGKILSSREKLKFHMRTHTGYKPFDCTYCGKCFTKKPILVEHIRIHTGERPYVCEYCTKAFSQRSSLVIHIRSHTGERPFVCHLCQKGFVAKAMLNIHLKTCKGFILM